MATNLENTLANLSDLQRTELETLRQDNAELNNEVNRLASENRQLWAALAYWSCGCKCADDPTRDPVVPTDHKFSCDYPEAHAKIKLAVAQ